MFRFLVAVCVVTLLAADAVPAAPEIAPPPREVGAIKLRQLAEPWSSGLPDRRKKDLEDLMRDVPPKYRQMVKDYFEQLEKTTREKE